LIRCFAAIIAMKSKAACLGLQHEGLQKWALNPQPLVRAVAIACLGICTPTAAITAVERNLPKACNSIVLKTGL